MEKLNDGKFVLDDAEMNLFILLMDSFPGDLRKHIEEVLHQSYGGAEEFEVLEAFDHLIEKMTVGHWCPSPTLHRMSAGEFSRLNEMRGKKDTANNN